MLLTNMNRQPELNPMLTLLSDALKRKKTDFIVDIDRLENVMGRSQIDAHRRQGIEPPSKNVYFSTIQQYEASIKKVEEILVNKITVAVSVGQPGMTNERIEHALFVKQMYMSGELAFNDYIQKMYNLYPHRMQALPEELKGRIEACQQMIRDRA
jgi:hypothetical protein